MKNFFKKIVLVPFLLSLSCSSIPKQAQSQFQMRNIEEKLLANGMRIIYIEDHSLPRIGLQLMLNSGAAADEAADAGLSSFTVSMIDQGAGTRNALQIADAFAGLGSTLAKSTGHDYLMVSTAGLEKTKNQLLNLYADVILKPTFAHSEVERKRRQILADLQQLQDQPTEYASILLDKEVFAGHPYGGLTIGTEKSVQSISRTQIIKNYYYHFRPQNAILAVTGAIDADFKTKVEKVFSQWGQRNAEVKKLNWPTDQKSIPRVLYSKAGLKQAQIRFGHLAIARNHPNFLKVRLANLILGGAFASRLNQRIRDDLGLTYSIQSSLDAKADGGIFEISTFSRQEKVGELIQETEKVFADYWKRGVSQKELKAAKALLVGQFPAAIETVDRLATNLMILRRFGVSDDYLKNFFQNIEAISLSEVNAAIRTHMKPENLRVVIFADAAMVRPQLEKLGELEVRP